MYHRVYERPPVSDFLQHTSALSGNVKNCADDEVMACTYNSVL